MAQWPTAQTVITQAALELGLAQSSSELGDDVYALSNSNFAQLTALLKRAGRELLDVAQWTQLRQEWSVQFVRDASDYLRGRFGAFLLPNDFYEMINQSGWNRSTRLPVGGPLSEQEWQFLSSRAASIVFTVLFQPRNGMLQLYPPYSVPDGQVISFVYKSKNWIQRQSDYEAVPDWQASTNYKVGDMVKGNGGSPPFGFPIFRCVKAGISGTVGPDPTGIATGEMPTISGPLIDGTTGPKVQWNYMGISTSDNWVNTSSAMLSYGTQNAPTAGSDLVMFNEELIVAKLRLLWLQAKGFDSSDAERAYNDAVATSVGNDQPAPVINLTRGGMVVDKLLGPDNYPITGYGS